jgi:hypothetical protein
LSANGSGVTSKGAPRRPKTGFDPRSLLPGHPIASSGMGRSGKLLRCALAATGFVFLSPGRADSPPKADAFLDENLPATLKLDSISAPPANGKGPDVAFPAVKVTSFHQCLDLLGKVSGKRIVLPPGLLEWPDENSEIIWNSAFGVLPNMKIRELLNRLSQSIEMRWKYEPARDAIILTLKWERDDPRSSAELAKILRNTPPEPWTKLPQNVPNQVGGRDCALDEWRIAFDELSSRPENFPYAGTVRLYFGTHGDGNTFGSFPVMNLFVHDMRDVGGRPEILILNEQTPMCNKDSPGDISYYLFDENGKFIKGGVYAMGEGWEGQIVKAFATSNHEVTIDVGWGSFALSPAHAHFALEGGDFVLKGSTDFRGKERDAEESRKKFAPGQNGGELGVLKYSVAALDGH